MQLRKLSVVTLLAGTSAELVLPHARLHFCSLSRRVFHIRAGKTPSSPLCPLSVFEFLWSLSSSVRPSVRRRSAQRKRIPAVSPPVTPTGPSERKAASPERLEALFMLGRDSEAPPRRLWQGQRATKGGLAPLKAKPAN